MRKAVYRVFCWHWDDIFLRWERNILVEEKTHEMAELFILNSKEPIELQIEKVWILE